jgi:hypothetical protein
LDSNRFDDLSRRMAAGVSRRATLKGAAAALLGAVGLRQAATAQVSQSHCRNERCGNDPGVCNAGCVCCVFPNGNSRCRPPGACNPGTEACPPGEVVDPILGCVPDDVDCTTAPDGVWCAPGKVCLDGTCQGNAFCTTGEPCRDYVSGCGGPGCGTAPGRNGCIRTAEGGLVCAGEFSFTDLTACLVSADCPDGFICSGSCFDKYCYSLCGNPNEGIGSA